MKVIVNRQEELSLEKEQIGRFDSIEFENNTYHLLDDKKSYVARVRIEDFHERTYEISIGSNSYRVEIVTPLEEFIDSMGYALGDEQVADKVSAPMPGIILGVKVREGDQVKKGDTLLILEAMKMENAILCPRDAQIKKIFSKEGDTVDKNKLLIELE